MYRGTGRRMTGQVGKSKSATRIKRDFWRQKKERFVREPDNETPMCTCQYVAQTLFGYFFCTLV